MENLVDQEHSKLMKAYESGKNYSIRAYGGYESIKGNKPELFSCATSAFFERGSRLKRESKFTTRETSRKCFPSRLLLVHEDIFLSYSHPCNFLLFVRQWGCPQTKPDHRLNDLRHRSLRRDFSTEWPRKAFSEKILHPIAPIDPANMHVDEKNLCVLFPAARKKNND